MSEPGSPQAAGIAGAGMNLGHVRLGARSGSPSPSPKRGREGHPTVFIDAAYQAEVDLPQAVRAAQENDLPTLQALHKAKDLLQNAFYRVGSQRWTLLHVAADRGHAGLVKWLTGKKHLCNVRDLTLWTPLHCAAANGHCEAVQALLKAGADVDARNAERTSALHYLVRRELQADQRLQRTLELMLKQGALIDAKNCFDETPLQAAVTRGRHETVRWLLAHGCNVNAVNKFGETALMKAVALRDDEMTHILLEGGADPTFRSPESPIGDPIATAMGAGLLFLTGILEAAIERWTRRHPRDSPEDLRWAGLSPVERLQQSPLVARPVQQLPLPQLQALAAELELPPGGVSMDAPAWAGWALEHHVPRVVPEQLLGAPPPSGRYGAHLATRDPLHVLGALVVGKAPPEPVLVTVARADVLEGEVEALLWTVRGSFPLTLPADLLDPADAQHKGLFKYLRDYYAQLYSHQAERVQLHLEAAPPSPDFHASLLALERDDPQEPRRVAVGVLWVRAGQTTEEEIFGNDEADAPPAFRDFLSLLGRRVALAGHTGYRADLDVSGRNTTGTHSIYHTEDGGGGGAVEVMYHVAPLLPSLRDEEGQQMVRKRFVGNDLTAIVYLDPGARFPAPIRSQMLHTYLLVTALTPTPAAPPHYHVAVVRRAEVPAAEPPVGAPSVVGAGAVRRFVAGKVVRCQAAALRSPRLTQLLVRGPKAQAYAALLRHHAADLARHFDKDS